MDGLTAQRRSALMSRVRGKHTSPELAVRRMAHSLGLRFRLHRKDLPGRPDLVFPKHQTVVFVHGCFWHRHPRCKNASTPKSNVEFWRDKFERNVARDAKNRADLEAAGWRVETIWECEIKSGDALDKIRTVPTRTIEIDEASESPCRK